MRGNHSAKKAIVLIVLALLVLAGAGGGILLTQKNEDPILKVKAFDLLLPTSAFGPGWGNHSRANSGWAYLPGVIIWPPRPNNAVHVISYSNWSANQTNYDVFQEWIVVFNTATEASEWYHHQYRFENITLDLNSTDEGWYLPLNTSPNFQQSAFRINNVVVLASISIASTAPLNLSEAWFKALLDAQINIIISAPDSPTWNPKPPSALMISADDVNSSEPNTWWLSDYWGRNDSYSEVYRNGWGARETDLYLQLTEYSSPEEAIQEFILHYNNNTTHGTLGIGDQSYYWSDTFDLNQASIGEVVVRKGTRVFGIRWMFNEQGSISANETLLAISLATLQVSKLP